jgi:hypothetical protein
MKKIFENPRFKDAPSSWTGYVIGGHKITKYQAGRSRSASQPANGHGPALGIDDGAVQAAGLEGTATRTINRDFSRSFQRHFNSASVASSEPHLWDDCLPASGAL